MNRCAKCRSAFRVMTVVVIATSGCKSKPDVPAFETPAWGGQGFLSLRSVSNSKHAVLLRFRSVAEERDAAEAAHEPRDTQEPHAVYQYDPDVAGFQIVSRDFASPGPLFAARGRDGKTAGSRYQSGDEWLNVGSVDQAV